MIKYSLSLKADKRKYIEKNVLLRCSLMGLMIDKSSLTSGLFVEVNFKEFSIKVNVFNLDKSVRLFSWEDSFTWLL